MKKAVRSRTKEMSPVDFKIHNVQYVVMVELKASCMLEISVCVTERPLAPWRLISLFLSALHSADCPST